MAETPGVGDDAQGLRSVDELLRSVFGDDYPGDDDPFSLVAYLRSRPEFTDRQGRPLTIEQWSRMFADRAYKRVASTTVRRLWVSTVWMGMDHGYGNKPLYFETMVFPAPGSKRYRNRPWMEEYVERYTTELEARRGHQRIVDRIRACGVTALGTYRREKARERFFRELVAA